MSGSTLLSLVGIISSFFLIKYRQQVGDTIGEAEWMRRVGGVSMVIVIVAIFFFFWGLATLTGTTDLLFSGFIKFLPGAGQSQSTGGF